MRATGETTGSDGVGYLIPSDAAEILGWTVPRVRRNLALQEDPDVVQSVLQQLPPARGPEPAYVVSAAAVESARRHEPPGPTSSSVDSLSEAVARLEAISDMLASASGGMPAYARERPPTPESLQTAFAAAVEAQELAAERSANERRRLRAEQERLAAEEERLAIEEKERRALLDQLRELTLGFPPVR